FFFQAGDGIRDFHVTGVRTCALPIFRGEAGQGDRTRAGARGSVRSRRNDRTGIGGGVQAVRTGIRGSCRTTGGGPVAGGAVETRSAERRVGEGCRTPVSSAPDNRAGQ